MFSSSEAARGGSTAAWELAKRGRRVLLLDAATFPRVKLCAGWVTKKVMADLELEPGEYPPYHTAVSERVRGL